ncbi:hypothetical protein B0F90DRAFT_1809449 [Multifurca ochricompacta]|uniref:Uncharacterized protein n=1 Tax=Multifurca ochricompacta TaxID=376703 RepID=A0AAD4M6V4_9AGAM|nr:hypothetical protein B0F90DRAFT_1809449 [Multifurca ochricompacta]
MLSPPATSIPPLAIIMPNPPLTRCRSTLLSRAPSPRTPSMRSPAHQLVHLSSTDNRKSSDSWNSSNYDPADGPDPEWIPEHVLLLSRTLDALPAHVLTPFIGPVPPSNLLDKIARGVSQAKGPNEWPYSLRTTRSKLVELCRSRAKEVSAEQRRRTIIEEEDVDQDLEQFREVLQRTTNIKQPLYRQSSMDFMQSAKLESRGTDAFTRASRRLSHSDRLFPNPTYHPYARPSSADSHTLNVSTPSSTTLHSSRSAESQWKVQPSRSSYRRSVSTMSTSSSSSLHSLPRAPVRRTDSFGKARKSMKRAPSFSVDAKGSDVSSDEEEHVRTKKTKKTRRGVEPRLDKTSSPGDSPVHRPRTSLQRNSSMFGPELPHQSPPPATYSQLAPAHLLIQIPALGAHPPPLAHSPRTPRTQRTLRRMRPIPSRSARRISFSSLDENETALEPVDIIPNKGLGHGLDSAFQLR